MSDEAGRRDLDDLDDEDEGEEEEGDRGGGRRIRQDVERRTVVVVGHEGEGRSDRHVDGPCE